MVHYGRRFAVPVGSKSGSKLTWNNKKHSKQYLLKLGYKNSSITMLIKNTKRTYQILLTARPVKTLRDSTYRYRSAGC